MLSSIRTNRGWPTFRGEKGPPSAQRKCLSTEYHECLESSSSWGGKCLSVDFFKRSTDGVWPLQVRKMDFVSPWSIRKSNKQPRWLDHCACIFHSCTASYLCISLNVVYFCLSGQYRCASSISQEINRTDWLFRTTADTHRGRIGREAKHNQN